MYVTNAQDDRAVLWARVSTLERERRYHRSMAITAEQEATYARQAWTHSMDCIRELRAEIRLLQGEDWPNGSKRWNMCSISANALTVGHDAAYALPWKTLMKMMTENYCPRSEIKKLETELWNLVVKGYL
ncbi:hypothetical protein Tco_0028880 [Tanacetum coccineum]